MAFSIGDRVLITGDHPRAGEQGAIRSPFPEPSPMPFDWHVTLDDGSEPAVAESDLLPVREGGQQ